MAKKYDIIIIGGGPAGLSAALTGARGRRSILVIDSGKARNAPADKMMNFPTREGISPLEFRKMIKDNLSKYPSVEFSSNEVIEIQKDDNGFLVDGIHAKKILLAHGVKDILPGIPGMKELFGKSIFHCPYCHGFEHADAAFGVMGDAEYLKNMIPLVRGLSADVIAFEQSNVEAFIHEDEHLTGVKLKSGEVVIRSFIFSFFSQKLSSDLGIKLGCEINELGHYIINGMGKTNVPGIFAAGDCVIRAQSVLAACASGQVAGAAMNMEILNGT